MNGKKEEAKKARQDSMHYSEQFFSRGSNGGMKVGRVIPK